MPMKKLFAIIIISSISSICSAQNKPYYRVYCEVIDTIEEKSYMYQEYFSDTATYNDMVVWSMKFVEPADSVRIIKFFIFTENNMPVPSYSNHRKYIHEKREYPNGRSGAIKVERKVSELY